MEISESDLFIGICFFLSTFSKDEYPEACVVSRARRVVSTGFSSISLLGDEGTSERFALAPFHNYSSTSGLDVYVDHTPSSSSLKYLANFDFKRLVYFETQELDTKEASLLSAKVVRFRGNLNWIRDRIATMKDSDIFI